MKTRSILAVAALCALGTVPALAQASGSTPATPSAQQGAGGVGSIPAGNTSLQPTGNNSATATESTSPGISQTSTSVTNGGDTTMAMNTGTHRHHGKMKMSDSAASEVETTRQLNMAQAHQGQ